ncbi:MAG TPA: phosphoglycerate mutase family protein [Wenzhouxiangella sp.]|nr:phosphoglycerate mutase family protein [Wenzhouxiangella sp.]
MPRRISLVRIFLLLIALALPLTGTAAPDGIIVVRHAEKADDGTSDPELSAAGRERARSLSESLRHAEIAGLIATQYRRTQQTLSGLAERTGLEITTVSAESEQTDAHIAQIVSRVEDSQAGGLLVVAGHSNTVPLIVEALSGRSIATLDESVYDRMFILLPTESGMAVVATKYGAPSQPAKP